MSDGQYIILLIIGLIARMMRENFNKLNLKDVCVLFRGWDIKQGYAWKCSSLLLGTTVVSWMLLNANMWEIAIIHIRPIQSLFRHRQSCGSGWERLIYSQLIFYQIVVGTCMGLIQHQQFSGLASYAFLPGINRQGHTVNMQTAGHTLHKTVHFWPTVHSLISYFDWHPSVLPSV